MSETPQLPMHRVERIHFIGVCGAGMSGLAEVFCNLGYRVSGSDLAESPVATRLRAVGVEVASVHDAANVRDADVVVYSSAVAEENVELAEARQRRIPVVPRAEMLAELMRFRRGIAIAGTHGKTTTTSLIASVLAEAAMDPTFIVGGLVRSANSNARLGGGAYLVAEADESDGSFLRLNPLVAVLTNVDADHMETYEGDFETLKSAFVEFFRRLPFYGVACVCADDPHAASLVPEIHTRVITFGLDEGADVRGFDLRHEQGREHFRVEVHGVEQPRPFVLSLPGVHNVQNALAAIAVAVELGVDMAAVRSALAGFQGIARRCQVHPSVRIGAHGVTLVDDYGHHPREIEAVIDTCRRSWPDRRLVLVFQPHRYSRTRALFEDFVAALSRVDVLLLLEVYAAGEKALPGVDGRALCGAVRTRGAVEPVFVEGLDEVAGVLADVVEDDDVVALLGAGSIGTVAEALVA